MTIGGIVQAIFNRLSRPTTAPRVDSGSFGVYADYFISQTDDLADRLGEGDITTDEWVRGMRREIQSLHTTAYTIGVGGIDNLTQQDLNDIAAIVNVQFGYLDNWANDLRAKVEGHMGTLLPADVQAVKSRAQLYLLSANSTIQSATVQALGMPELPAVPADGSSRCLTRCQCKWQFRRVPGGWDCIWKLGIAEHCPTCIARANAWNPLEIRAGQIINPGGEELFYRR